MGIIEAFTGAIKGTFADQWKDIITVGRFDEHTAVSPGILQNRYNDKGTSSNGYNGVLSNGSKIFIPENTAAFIFSQSGIENIITTPGGYEYQDGQESIFNNDDIDKAIFQQIKDRLAYGGKSSEQKQIAFVNLREIRDIKFGTRGALVYNDLFYGVDLEVYAFGSFSIKIINVERFIKNYVPANVNYYSFDNKTARAQMISEFIQSLTVAINAMSYSYRISQLPSQANLIAKKMIEDDMNVGSWKERFGFEIVKIAIENIELSPESKELINQYSTNKMNIKAYEDVSQRDSNIAAQQKIAQGIQDKGLGDSGGMVFGLNMAQGINSKTASFEGKEKLSLDEQITMITKLKDLLDNGILTQEEFDIKKKEILDL